jgi:hypothetical protein
MIGINDLNAQTATIQDICARWELHMGEAQAAGFDVVACTVLPSDTGIDSEPWRQTLNAYIRKSVARNGYKLLDWESICPVMGVKGAEQNATNFQVDKLHPTSTGQSLLAAAAVPVLSSFNT